MFSGLPVGVRHGPSNPPCSKLHACTPYHASSPLMPGMFANDRPRSHTAASNNNSKFSHSSIPVVRSARAACPPVFIFPEPADRQPSAPGGQREAWVWRADIPSSPGSTTIALLLAAAGRVQFAPAARGSAGVAAEWRGRSSGRRGRLDGVTRRQLGLAEAIEHFGRRSSAPHGRLQAFQAVVVASQAAIGQRHEVQHLARLFAR